MYGNTLRKIPGSLYYLKTIGKNFCSSKNANDMAEELSMKKKSFDSILYKRPNDNIMEIIFNEPKRQNCLDLKMIKSFLKLVRSWEKITTEMSSTEDESDSEHSTLSEFNIPKLLIMSGQGGKHFCNGVDMVSLYNEKIKKTNVEKLKGYFRYMYALDYELAKSSPIKISIWNGHVTGGGVGISINSNIRIATDNTIFSLPETSIGFFPDGGSTYWLPRLFNNNPSIGLYMGLTGNRLKGIDIAKCGVATNFVPSSKIEDLKNELLQMDEKDFTKLIEIIDKYSEFKYNSSKFDFPKLEEICQVFVVDELANIFERLENLAQNGSEGEKLWCSNTLKMLKNASPISLIITLEQIKRGIKMKKPVDAENLECQIVKGFIGDSDFFEGIRARYIDKDQTPKWKHNSFREIDEIKLIDTFFDRPEYLEQTTEVIEEGEQETKS